jgi:hypothetical protein
MCEFCKQNYLKEEEFLEMFYDVACVVEKILDEEWKPNSYCDDSIRKNQQYFLSTGELNSLIFDSASIYHDEKGFSSAQIVLRSSKRLVTVRVKSVNGKLIGEKIVDRPVD